MRLFLLIAILATTLQNFLPWWTIGLIACGSSYAMARSAAHAFWASAGALFLVWLTMATYIDFANKHILATRVATMFGLSKPAWLLLISALVGALPTGIAGLAGYYLKKGVLRPKHQV